MPDASSQEQPAESGPSRALISSEVFQKCHVGELAAQTEEWLREQGRLTEPLWLMPDGTRFEAITWDEAMARIARELHALASPDEAVFAASGHTGNEAAFLYQLFARQFGANNLLEYCDSRHEASVAAISAILDAGLGTVPFAEIEQAGVILLFGLKLDNAPQKLLPALQQAKRNGCKIISVNPIKAAGQAVYRKSQSLRGLLGKTSPLTDIYLEVRAGCDVALLKGLMKYLVEADDEQRGFALNHPFIAEHTSGFDALAAELRATDWKQLIHESNISRDEMQDVVRLLIGTTRIVTCWGKGITRHPAAVRTIEQIANLLLLRGSIGKPAAGVCPIGGLGNVQNLRAMGIGEQASAAWLDKLRDTFGFEPPRKPGLNTPQAIETMYAGRAKVFFALGGNFVSSMPDPQHAAEALRNCALTVQVATRLSRSLLVTGRQACILPGLGCAALRSASIANSPDAGPLSQPVIVARLAQAVLGDKSHIDWNALAADHDRIRELIAAVPSASYNAPGKPSLASRKSDQAMAGRIPFRT